MASKTFVVERNNGSAVEKVEVQAERGEQETGSTRVTFFSGTDSVASFINISAWYVKPAAK